MVQWEVKAKLYQGTKVITDLLLIVKQRLDHHPLHLPQRIRQLGRLKTIDGHLEESKRSEQWITDPCHRHRRESDLTVQPLEHQILTRGEMLYPTIRVTTLQQFHQQSL